jgi:hypothetical protein
MERLSPLRGDDRAPDRAELARPGAVADGDPELAPRGVGQLLDVATDSIKRRFAPCVGLAFLFWLPGQWIVRDLRPETGDEADLLLGILATNLITVVESMLISAAVAVITYGTMQGRRVPLGEVLTRLVACMPAIFVAMMLTTSIIIPGFLACFLPGFFFMWRLLFTPTIVVIEGLGPIRALQRSWALTRQGVSRWLATVLVTYFYMAPFTIGIVMYDESFLQGLVPVASPGLISAVSLGLEAFLLAVSSAFYGVLVTVLYVDAKVRIEAFDLELGLERVASGRGAVTSGPASEPVAGGGLA